MREVPMHKIVMVTLLLLSLPSQASEAPIKKGLVYYLSCLCCCCCTGSSVPVPPQPAGAPRTIQVAPVTASTTSAARYAAPDLVTQHVRLSSTERLQRETGISVEVLPKKTQKAVVKKAGAAARRATATIESSADVNNKVRLLAFAKTIKLDKSRPDFDPEEVFEMAATNALHHEVVNQLTSRGIVIDDLRARNIAPDQIAHDDESPVEHKSDASTIAVLSGSATQDLSVATTRAGSASRLVLTDMTTKRASSSSGGPDIHSTPLD